MALPTCECVKGLPIGEQLAAIYCATYTLAAGDVDGPYLLKSANLSDVDDAATALSNIGGAASGANTDITSLGGVLNIGSGGATPTAATYPKVLAYGANTQTLTSGGTTDTVVYDTEVQDTAGAFSANAFTVPANAAGWYLINCSFAYAGAGTPSSFNIAIYVNGSFSRNIHQLYSQGSGREVICPDLLPLAAGDVVTIRATQSDGAAWDLFGGLEWRRIAIARIF